MISKFKAAGKVDPKDLDQLFWQAGSRVVGMIHLLIQVLPDNLLRVLVENGLHMSPSILLL